MQNAIKRFINGAILGAVITVVLGILFLVFPEEALDVFRWIIAIFAFIGGAFMIIAELSKTRSAPFFGATALGAVLIVIGLIFATRPAAINIFAIVLGAWFIVSALGSLRFTAALSNGAAFFSVLMALVSLLVGILLIVNPWGGSISMMILIGVSLIVFGAASLIDACVIKRNAKDVAKKLGITTKK